MSKAQEPTEDAGERLLGRMEWKIGRLKQLVGMFSELAERAKKGGKKEKIGIKKALNVVLSLFKGKRIKGEPGLVLKPSKENPQVNRWQRTGEKEKPEGKGKKEFSVLGGTQRGILFKFRFEGKKMVGELILNRGMGSRREIIEVERKREKDVKKDP